MKLTVRDVPPRVAWALEQAGVPALLARLYAARGVTSAEELDDGLARLLAPADLLGAAAAARRLADAVAARQRICVVADYDCDGATACAVALRGLAMLGAAPGTLAYVVPDRALHGYGLTPAIVDLALAQRPELLLTVDNGIASVEGVAHARARGLAVIVTDHHLPAMSEGAVRLPDADVIVNPNQPGCGFASKHLAGVGQPDSCISTSHKIRTRLVDPDTETEITEPGRPGELRGAGPTMFAGYYRAPALTAKAFDAKGYYRSGDLFEIAGERQQFYRFVGRCKDIVVRGGMKISAEEVEALLLGHPAVADAAVVAVPDAQLGEKVGACIVPRQGSPTLPELVRYLRDDCRLATFKLPEQLMLVEALPRNPVGKLIKRELRERFAAARESRA